MLPQTAHDPEDHREPSPVFATTHWSVILAAGEPNSGGSRDALEALCRTYWFPAYAFVRHRGYGPEDAEDLTQSFFARFLERRAFAVADPARGRFRAFLLVSLRNFLANERDRNRAAKRGGGVAILSLDEGQARERYAQVASPAESPDALYDRIWARTVLTRVTERLRDEYTRSGRLDRFHWLEGLLPGEPSEFTYEELGQRHGLTVSAIKSEVHRFRTRYRALLRREIAHTVVRSEDIDHELQELRAAVTG